MSSNLELIRKSINGAPIRAVGDAMGKAVVVTDDELVTGKTGLLGWGGKVEHFALAGLASVNAVPNPSANLLTLEFGGAAPASLMLMFGPAEQQAFEEIAAALQARLARQTGGAR